MVENTFKLNNRDEVQCFEEFLHAYEKEHYHFAVEHLSLVGFFDALQGHPDGGRIFVAILDIKISLSILWGDIHEVGAAWNKNFSKGKMEGGTISDSFEKFSGKMDVHRFSSAFILHYRALWDKIMGLFILFYVPNQYNSFCRAKSRQKRFLSLASHIPQIGRNAASEICNVVEQFDKLFRTPEAHGTGTLRKWSFLMEPMNKNPHGDLFGYWNYMNKTITSLNKMLL